MPNLIDISYFVAELDIPNTDNAGVAESVNFFIAKYEKEFLQKLLGYPLYKAFMAGQADQRMKDIIDGKEYTGLDTMVRKWEGLKDAAAKTSCIANYVYYWYMRSNTTQSTGVGEVRTDGENATAVSPRQKMITSWNEMRRQVLWLMDFLEANQSTYQEWNLSYRDHTISAFGFINPLF